MEKNTQLKGPLTVFFSSMCIVQQSWAFAEREKEDKRWLHHGKFRIQGIKSQDILTSAASNLTVVSSNVDVPLSGCYFRE